MKKHICETLCLLDSQHITDEHLKYEIRKFAKTYAKELSGKSKISGLQIVRMRSKCDWCEAATGGAL